MKTTHILLVILLMIGVAANAQKKEEQKVTFSVNLTCEHCKMTIMKNLPYEKGVTDVAVDVENKEVTVTFKKDKITVDQIIKAFDKMGYKAVEKKENAVKTEG